MSVYIIAIGGTGAKFVEAVSHLAAAGIYAQGDRTEKIEILFVDPDTGNGNLKAANSAVTTYQKCANTIDTGANADLNWWMQTEVSLFQQGVWSPFKDQDEFSLRDVFKYDDYSDGDQQSIRHLFDVLYTPEERDLNLKEGFRGRPAIGSAIMTQLRQDEDAKKSWKELVEKIDSDSKADPNNPPKVFLCGSIFGGTGAAGFPTLGRLIANELKSEAKGDLLSKIKLGGLLILPYFRFSSYGQDEQETVYARAEDFIIKTEAALRYYGSQDLKFDSVYLLGMPSMTHVENFSTGGNNQRNNPHILELLGGVALQDFIISEKPESKQVILLGRKQPSEITWGDIPDQNDNRQKLINSVRFAYIWRTIYPQLEYAKKKLIDVKFANRFFKRDTINQSSEWEKINAIKDWCDAYLKWLGILHSDGSGVKLFNPNAFYSQGSLKTDNPDHFLDLVPQRKDKEIERLLRNLSNQNLDGTKQGTVGLAKALYCAVSENSI